MDMRIPPLKIQIVIESNPQKSGILVQYGDWPDLTGVQTAPGPALHVASWHAVRHWIGLWHCRCLSLSVSVRLSVSVCLCLSLAVSGCLCLSPAVSGCPRVSFRFHPRSSLAHCSPSELATTPSPPSKSFPIKSP